MTKNRLPAILLTLVFLLGSCRLGRSQPVLPAPPTQTPAPPLTPTFTSTPGPLGDPFAARNMFFGLSLLKSPSDGVYATDLGVSWVSLQPHVLWFALEQEPDDYDWSPLDAEVKWLQVLGLDITMVLVPSNIFGERRAELAQIISEQAASSDYDNQTSSFIAFMRSPESKTWRLHLSRRSLQPCN